LSDFSEVQAIFAKIASSITTYNSTTDITFKISYGGTDEICLVFDGLDHNASQCKIQATVNSDKSFSNIQYTGLTSSSGSTVQGVDPDGALYHYTFTNVKKTDGTILDTYEIKNVKLYRSILGWGIDTEFNPASATNTAVTKKTAAIALVLDISSSLGSNLSSVKFAAKSFIDNLVSPSDYYTVTYSANGGTGMTPNAQTVQKGSMITLASGDGLEKTNSTFDGWNTKTDGTGTNYYAGSSYTVNGNVTLYAKWIGGTWTQKADFAGGRTEMAVGFSIGNKGYIGTGLQVDGEQDFWEYDPSLNSWTQKANFAGGDRKSAVGFSIGNKGYIGTGSGNNANQDFWEFTP